VLLAVALIGGACQEGDDGQQPPAPAEDTLEIGLRWDSGEVPSELRVLLDDGTERTALSCPTTPDEDVTPRCDGDGVHLGEVPAALRVVVKARGWRTLQTNLDLSAERAAGGTQRVSLAPVPLDPFEVTADYRTGFAAEDGSEAFAEMAHPFATELGPSLAVKFYLELDGPDGQPQVWFQNTRRHPIHYQFVRTVLGRPLTMQEFEHATYRGLDRSAMAGTLVWYPQLRAPADALAGQHLDAPVTLSFFPSDDLTPAQALLAYGLLEERLGFASLVGGRDRLVYLPAGQRQEDDLREAEQAFAGLEGLWLRREEMYGSQQVQILNPGLAYGTLKRMSPEELESTVVSFSDVLVLTRLPNTLPIVGGTITEERQTPLAHVNVAARTRGTPNIAHLGANEDEHVRALLGELVRFEVAGGEYTIEPTNLQEAQAFWDSRSREPFSPPFDLLRDELAEFGELSFGDSLSVGVKAANLAELRNLLGEQAPDGFAVPFHFYDAFLRDTSIPDALCDGAHDDCLEEGRPLAVCDRARARCGLPDGEPEVLLDKVERVLGDPDVATDSALREAALDSLRWVMRHVEVAPEFAAALDDHVQQRFGNTKVRLRSSTNAEDLEDFSGAGLYTSVSARGLGDDAPSREIRKVWASVFNWRAFEERSFWSIDHDAVRMGVAAHPAYPNEAANGVLITQNIADPAVAGMYVNVQRGETPVTNPEDGALPEIFSILPAPDGLQVARQRFSSLSEGRPIMSDAEVRTLYTAASKVQRHFAALYEANPFALALDIEFKLNGPERALIIKQVRPYTVGGL